MNNRQELCIVPALSSLCVCNPVFVIKELVACLVSVPVSPVDFDPTDSLPFTVFASLGEWLPQKKQRLSRKKRTENFIIYNKYKRKHFLLFPLILLRLRYFFIYNFFSLFLLARLFYSAIMQINHANQN